MNKLFNNAVLTLLYLVFFLYRLLFSKKKQSKLILGVDPLVNNKYWSKAMMKDGYESITFMIHHYANTNKNDFDLYFDYVVPNWAINFKSFKNCFRSYFAFLHS